MLARGEVGLIFAGVGASTGLLTPGTYAAVVAMKVVTAIVATTLAQGAHPADPRRQVSRRGGRHGDEQVVDVSRSAKPAA